MQNCVLQRFATFCIYPRLGSVGTIEFLTATIGPRASLLRMPEMELGLWVTGHRVTGSAILAGSGRVIG